MLASFFPSCNFEKKEKEFNNYDKELFSSFYLINQQLNNSNTLQDTKNIDFINSLELNGFGSNTEIYKTAKQVHKITKKLDNHLSKIIKIIKSNKDYKNINNSNILDTVFFKNNTVSQEGLKFLSQINGYRNEIVKTIGIGFKNTISDIKEKFNTNAIINGEGDNTPWLNYHFKETPLIASLTKISLLQYELKTIESEILSKLLINQYESSRLLTSYTTMLLAKKMAYYSGETFDGVIVLGRRDTSTPPSDAELYLDGKKLIQNKDFKIDDDMVKLNVNTGKPGEHKIEGKLIYRYNGMSAEVSVSQSFGTIPKTK